MSVIKIQDLEFAYQKGQPILNQLSMDVPAGSIYGFLGSNGAGKSTTIRTLLGLLRPRSGELHILGQNLREAKRDLFKQVGSLIEAPSLYSHMNARDHLRLACGYFRLDTQRIEPLLDQVGLLAQQRKATRKYSTGMKQRLGLAIAMIHHPSLLILDEPTNGLDPQGISDIRSLLLQLKQAGKTILLSSHLLSEIERMATQVGIIKDGKMLFEGSINALEQWKSKQQLWEIRVNNPQQALVLLAEEGSIKMDQEGTLLLKVGQEADIPDIVRRLVNARIDIYELRLQKNDLEQLFINATQN